MNNFRGVLLGLAQDAIAAVHGERLAGAAASCCKLHGPLHLVAIGKAAAAMTAGAAEVLGDNVQRALVITAEGYDTGSALRLDRVEILYGGHPLPSSESLSAGERLLRWLKETPADGRLLFMISGGTSAMVEVAAAGVALADLQRANQWLLASGMDIAGINAVRCRLSRIKGGRLLSYLGHHAATVWMLSDVAGDDPAVIGSGLLHPMRNTAVPDADYPAWLRQLLHIDVPQVPRSCIPGHRVLGNLASACRAAAQRAQQLGLPVVLHETELSGDAEATGRRLGADLVSAASGIHIWGGETTVRLPGQPGMGGRNQHLALAAALQLSGHTGVQLLALATDGRDGPGEDAGALVDGGTIERGALSDLDAEEQLRHADSGRYLEASGDLVCTGPTGTNVRDLVLAWKT